MCFGLQLLGLENDNGHSTHSYTIAVIIMSTPTFYVNSQQASPTNTRRTHASLLLKLFEKRSWTESLQIYLLKQKRRVKKGHLNIILFP